VLSSRLLASSLSLLIGSASGGTITKEMLCSNCGYKGKSKTYVKGSAAVEILLWLMFIIPGLIYTAWRSSSRYKACPKCKQPNMLPLDSPVAQKMLKEITTE
jgi:hypothetical protein